MHPPIVYTYTHIRKYQSAIIPTFANTSLNLYSYSQIPVYTYSHIRKYQSTFIPLFANTSLHLYPHSQIPVYIYTPIRKYQSTLIPTFANTSLHLYPHSQIPVYTYSYTTIRKYQSTLYTYIHTHTPKLLDTPSMMGVYCVCRSIPYQTVSLLNYYIKFDFVRHSLIILQTVTYKFQRSDTFPQTHTCTRIFHYPKNNVNLFFLNILLYCMLKTNVE